VSAVEAGSQAPAFTLQREDGTPFTEADLDGRTTVLVFFPLAFSPVCTDQLTLYQEVLEDFREQGAELYGVSCDSTYALHAFRKHLGIDIPLLSDFHPKGEATRAFGLYREQNGFPERAIVITGPDRTVRMRWVGEHPGVLPGANVIFDGLAGTTAGA
jgi:mycoredoxin-dependent peroxiredoxin